MILAGCSTGTYKENYSNELYDGYIRGKKVQNDDVTEKGLELINTTFTDDKVHIYADGNTFLVDYQHMDPFYYDTVNSSSQEFKFLTNQSLKTNGFYEMYTLSEDYPEDYKKFIDNPPEFEIDGRELEITFEEVNYKLCTEQFENGKTDQGKVR